MTFTFAIVLSIYKASTFYKINNNMETLTFCHIQRHCTVIMHGVKHDSILNCISPLLSIFIQVPCTLVERGLYCNHLVCPSVHSHFRNRYLNFYWKKWFYIWYMALAWWLVPCLPFSGLLHIYFLFTVRLTNERLGVFLARRSVQHLVVIGRKPDLSKHNL